MTKRKTQLEQLTEVATANGWVVKEEEAKFTETARSFTKEDGTRVYIAFDNNKIAGGKGGFITYGNNGGGGPLIENFTWFKRFFGPQEEKEIIPKVELTDSKEVAVGTGVTCSLYTDAHSYTIVKVINENKIVVRRCTAKLVESFKPNMVAGGFAAHTTNNNEQEYTYEDNEENGTAVLTLRKNGWWEVEGTAIGRSNRWTIGRRSEFYDYNF